MPDARTWAKLLISGSPPVSLTSLFVYRYAEDQDIFEKLAGHQEEDQQVINEPAKNNQSSLLGGRKHVLFFTPQLLPLIDGTL